MAFHESQLQAIHHQEGPMMVLAGPGSGKTTVITHRVKYLVEECRVEPGSILVITFTKAAAQEMRQRFEKLTEGRRLPVSFGTFHAVFFAILKRAYRYDASNIAQDEQRTRIIRELVDKLQMDVEDEAEFTSQILSEISLVKGEMMNLDYYYSKNCSEELFKKLYQGYEKAMVDKGLLDFDDMLVLCYELFTQRKDILAAWQNKYQYILIDEFQDINRVQYEIVRMLAAPRNNLFIVGDDDQSIYRFRGAKPEIMLHFKDDYPEAETVLLDVNYRSVKNIVTSAGYLIGHNKERFQKKIEAADQGDIPVEWQLFESQRKENARIIWDIQEAVEKGAKYEEFAVLFRTNTQPRLLMEQLMEYNIPFRTRDTVPNLYEHWIAKDIFAYIRIAMGSRERRDFLQIMNRPKRYISRESLDEETVAFDVWEWYYEEQPWVAKRIEKLEGDIRMLERLSPYAAINYIRKAIGYDEFCAEYADYRRIKADDLFDVLDELLDAAREYRTYDAWFDHIENYTKGLQEFYRVQNQNPNSVALATLHSAKGLEYENVYIIDVNEGVMPYKKAVLEPEVEEERRMFYVGMTRAKKNLHLFSVRQLNHKDAEISRFIKEAQRPEKKKD